MQIGSLKIQSPPFLDWFWLFKKLPGPQPSLITHSNLFLTVDKWPTIKNKKQNTKKLLNSTLTGKRAYQEICKWLKDKGNYFHSPVVPHGVPKWMAIIVIIHVPKVAGVADAYLWCFLYFYWLMSSLLPLSHVWDTTQAF